MRQTTWISTISKHAWMKREKQKRIDFLFIFIHSGSWVMEKVKNLIIRRTFNMIIFIALQSHWIYIERFLTELYAKSWCGYSNWLIFHNIIAFKYWENYFQWWHIMGSVWKSLDSFWLKSFPVQTFSFQAFPKELKLPNASLFWLHKLESSHQQQQWNQLTLHFPSPFIN